MFCYNPRAILYYQKIVFFIIHLVLFQYQRNRVISSTLLYYTKRIVLFLHPGLYHSAENGLSLTQVYYRTRKTLLFPHSVTYQYQENRVFRLPYAETLSRSSPDRSSLGHSLACNN